MNSGINSTMHDAVPLDANPIHRERGVTALRDVLDVMPPRENLLAPKSGLEVVCMADVRPAAVEWLWQNWLAVGKVHVLAGEGGRGKSTILCNITAITTVGNKWPDGALPCQPGSVIIPPVSLYWLLRMTLRTPSRRG